MTRWLWALPAVAAILVLAWAGGSETRGAPGGGTIVIGSKNFTENRLLAEIMGQLVEARTDITVERRVNLGGTTMVFSALESGAIDIYPEYTGTGWAIHLGRTDRVANPLKAYLHVARQFEKRWKIRWMQPFGFSNSYALAMAEERARELGVTRISDLLPIQGDLLAGVSHEFLNREDGFPGLAEAYGLRIGDIRGMEHGLAYEALITGRVDLVDTWTTDGKLLRYKITILKDDRAFFPPYDAAPIARMATLRRHPGLETLLNRLAFRLDDEKMRRLNYRVEEDGGTFEEVARDFLASEGLVGEEEAIAPDPNAAPPEGFATYMISRAPETLRLVGEHVVLTAAAVMLSILVAVPAGILLTRKERLVGPVMGAAGVIQTVPSLALLAFMIPLPGLGLGARSAIAALFLYALLPIVRNTYTGIKEVDPDLLEAARGMGLEDRQVLTKVQLPLGVRTIMAGIRTSTVISIGVATLAAFIGAGGLGDPIITGLQLNDTRLILSGALPAAVLAILADMLLGRLERLLSPPGAEAPPG